MAPAAETGPWSSQIQQTSLTDAPPSDLGDVSGVREPHFGLKASRPLGQHLGIFGIGPSQYPRSGCWLWSRVELVEPVRLDRRGGDGCPFRPVAREGGNGGGLAIDPGEVGSVLDQGVDEDGYGRCRHRREGGDEVQRRPQEETHHFAVVGDGPVQARLGSSPSLMEEAEHQVVLDGSAKEERLGERQDRGRIVHPIDPPPVHLTMVTGDSCGRRAISRT